MGIPQDWAPYSSVEEAAKVYLRDPELALDQLRSSPSSCPRGSTEESWGEPLWQEIVLTDGRRLIMWRGDAELSTADDRERRVLNASVRTILLSTITDHVLGDDTRRLSEVRLQVRRQRRPGPDATPSAVRPGAFAVYAVVRTNLGSMVAKSVNLRRRRFHGAAVRLRAS